MFNSSICAYLARGLLVDAEHVEFAYLMFFAVIRGEVVAIAV